jgi:16S rRNA (cytidine1402-2'-O)-methyltransferase
MNETKLRKGKLYVIPSVIAEDTQAAVIPMQVRAILPSIQFFLAEDVRTARRYLSSLKVFNSIEPLHFEVLNKDTPGAALRDLMKPALEGNDVGILSESGCPGVADPGAKAIAFAHEHGIQVVPLVGPSSILLALMASGLNGQCFAFQGYLPVNAQDAAREIKNFERESKQKNQTQIFIETPYRNNSRLSSLLKNLSPTTMLSVAVDITGQSEVIRTYLVEQWRSIEIELPKSPAIFLILAS